MEMVNNGKMFIRRVRGDYWAALAMTAILNACQFARIHTVMWGDREHQGLREIILFIWVNAPRDTDREKFCGAQLDIIDKALGAITGFKTAGEFPNAP